MGNHRHEEHKQDRELMTRHKAIQRNNLAKLRNRIQGLEKQLQSLQDKLAASQTKIDDLRTKIDRIDLTPIFLLVVILAFAFVGGFLAMRKNIEQLNTKIQYSELAGPRSPQP